MLAAFASIPFNKRSLLEQVFSLLLWYRFFTIFGCTDLRIGISGAKSDTEVDFEVYIVPAPQTLNKNLKSLIFGPIKDQ